METKYVVPAQTRTGHVHLKVADIKRSLAFYCDLLGFKVSTLYGDQAAFISAGGYPVPTIANDYYRRCDSPIIRHYEMSVCITSAMNHEHEPFL